MELPSLPERTADILPLAEHFIGVYGEKLQRPLPTLDRDAKQALLGNPWPGNIRELDNVMHVQSWSRARRSSAAICGSCLGHRQLRSTSNASSQPNPCCRFWTNSQLTSMPC